MNQTKLMCSNDLLRRKPPAQKMTPIILQCLGKIHSSINNRPTSETDLPLAPLKNAPKDRSFRCKTPLCFHPPPTDAIKRLSQQWSI